MKKIISYRNLSFGESRLFEVDLRNALAVNDKLVVYNSSENVYGLLNKDNSPSIPLGDHYGNPKDAMISFDLKYIVSVGCGLIINKIEIKNKELVAKTKSQFLDDVNDYWPIEEVYQLKDELPHLFRFIACTEKYDEAEYRFNTIDNTFELIKVIKAAPRM